jgi:hypothetical protein
MPSDIARRSYDERQQYRSVVAQQGRVTLEADWNEAAEIAAEELRQETLEIVGPSGTPDNGYAITPGPGFDFSIGHGTMYVGGERVSLPNPAETTPPGQELLYSQQNQPVPPGSPPRPAEWLDAAIDPDFVPVPQNTPSPEFIYLQLREQEISAVEDSDLKDVALGGPDTAQRTRLIQHIVRRPGGTCAAGLRLAGLSWAREGLTFNNQTMRLLSAGSLQVGFTGQAPPPDPCQPQAQSGYLGADNQLIRVQISDVAPVSSEPGILAPVVGGNGLLWGYDDASFLYHIDVVNPTTLHLQTAPVDANHQPRAGQAVEVLMAAAQLGNGEFVAAPSGFVTTVATAYNPDTQIITIADPLPVVYGDGTAAHPSPPRVFLRVWEEHLPFTADVPVPLNATGIQVTLTLSGGTAFHLGDFWMFAVRPSTPQQVYPERLQAAAQPPNGPRLWACPLGVITWSVGAPGGTVQDCRRFFSPLTDLVLVEANGGPAVGPRHTLNFIGTGITATDNPVANRIDITIPSGGGVAETSPTNLLFPFVTSQVGFDTAIAVSNTTADPFGTTHQSGKITFNYFPNPLGVPQVVGPVAAGDQFTFLVSTVAPNFRGYIIAVCEFAGAYGFALITDSGQKTSSAYLPIVLPKRPIGS